MIPRPKPAVANISMAVLTDPSTRLVDESLRAHLVASRQRLPFALSPSTEFSKGKELDIDGIYPKKIFVLSVTTRGAARGDYATAAYHVLSHRAAPGTEEEKIEQVLGREYYRLTCLGRTRFGYEDGTMPVHLEGVRTVLEGFNRVMDGPQN
jgi:hypothetical protein